MFVCEVTCGWSHTLPTPPGMFSPHKNLSGENGIGVGRRCCVTVDSVFIVRFHDSVLDCGCLVFAQPVRNAADSTRLLVKHETAALTPQQGADSHAQLCSAYTNIHEGTDSSRAASGRAQDSECWDLSAALK